MIQVYVLNISPLYNKDVFQHFYKISSTDRKNKADHCKLPADKARCIGAGILLSCAYELYQKKELANANSFGAFTVNKYIDLSDKLDTTESGKPFLKNQGIDEPYISISHSGEFAAIAIGMSDVGIDIQQLVTSRDAVVKRCFTQKELQRINYALNNSHQEADRVFTQIWSQKEAVSKLDGRGITSIWESIGNNVPNPDTQLSSIWLDKEYVLSVAWKKFEKCSQKSNDDFLEPIIMDYNEVFKC